MTDVLKISREAIEQARLYIEGDEETHGRQFGDGTASDDYQADAGAPALSEKVTLPSEQEAFLLRDFASYLALGPEFVSAYRGGLSSAMGICDLLANEFGSRNKGARRASDALNLAADRIELFRSKCTAKLNFSNDAERDPVSLKSDTSSQPASESRPRWHAKWPTLMRGPRKPQKPR